MKRIDLTGKKFNEWEVLEYLGDKKYLCRCSCGAIQEVRTYKLTSGQSKSCGHATNKFIDLTGQQFGDWKVLDYAGDHKWNCQCSCGKIKPVNSIYLRDGRSTSCGHATTGFKDITGQRFGDWVAIKPVGMTLWECECQCANKTHRNVKLYDLLAGRTKSCGHATTGFKDITGQQFGEWTVVEYLYDTLWLCVCSCGTVRAIKSQALRSGYTMSCGCKHLEHTIKTNIKKYGVPYSGQRHRTPQEVLITLSKENMEEFIKQTWNYKPTADEIAEKVGLQKGQALIYVHKYELENLVNINPFTSKVEMELASYFPECIRSVRWLLKGREIDLYCADAKVGIEFNGTYWHSTIFKTEEYHQEKSLIALENNIRLIHVFEYEWNNEDIKRKLIAFLCRSLREKELRVVQADACEIKNISNTKDEVMFLEEYHIQGYEKSDICYGCYCEEELIGVMSFRHNNVSDAEYELIRLAWRDDLKVCSGSERMLKTFVSDLNPASIVHYCDIAKYSEETYKRLGFNIEKIIEPDYKWINPYTEDIIDSSETHNETLLELEQQSEDITEYTILMSLGYVKVYDCGMFKMMWRSK